MTKVVDRGGFAFVEEASALTMQCSSSSFLQFLANSNSIL